MSRALSCLLSITLTAVLAATSSGCAPRAVAAEAPAAAAVPPTAPAPAVSKADDDSELNTPVEPMHRYWAEKASS